MFTKKQPTGFTLLACFLTSIFIYGGVGAAEESSAANEDESQSNVILVTSQRREKSMQDVPIAMAAITGEDIENLSVNSLEGLIDHIPGVELFDERGAGMPVWVIRGVGLKDFNSNNSPTAAIYSDGVYLPSNVMNGIGMFDIDRVEVLKGPQGGLYGRNTTGGAVRVISERPTIGADTNGYFKASYGSWGRTGIEGAVGGSLSDTVAGRVAVMSDQGGGWQDSLATPEDDEWGDRDFLAVRAQLLFEVTEDFEIYLKINSGKDNSETALGTAVGTQDPVWLEPMCAEAIAGTISDNCITWSNATILYASMLGITSALPATPEVLASQLSDNGEIVASNLINEIDNEWTTFTMHLDWDLGFANFKSITGYADFDNDQNHDYDAMPYIFGHELGTASIKSKSQEFRLVSNSDSALSWILGASVSEDTIEESRDFVLTDNLVIVGQLGGADLGTRAFTQETNTWAIYAQAEFQLSDQLSVEGALRYTDESKNLRDASLVFNNVLVLFADENYDLDLEANWSGYVGLNWHPTDDVLTYAKMTRGYKSGGYNGGFTFEAAGLIPYIEETIWAYEIGIKSDLADNTIRFNAAAFYYDYQDAQGFRNYEVTPGNTIGKLANIGDAEHLGFEADVYWLPESIEGLSIGFGLAYVDAEYTDSDAIEQTVLGADYSFEGLKRHGPENSYNFQTRYEWSLMDNLLAAWQLDYSWRSSFLPDGVTPDVPGGDFGKFGLRDSYGILNARISIDSMDDTWSVALVGKNLTDEKYTLTSASDGLGDFWQLFGKPRAYGVEFNYNF